MRLVCVECSCEMTEERKLAIQMWQEIVNKCKARDDFNLVEFKKEFCKEHNLR